MALTLALPLFGLDPEQFSSLTLKLLNIEREQNARNRSESGRASPSTGSESSGVSSLATFASVELTPISSRSETPTKALCKSQKATVPLRIVYEGRDILNLGANIRSSVDWQMRDETLSRHNLQEFITNRLAYYRLREQPPIKDITKRCNECEFCEPSFIL